MSFTSSVQSVAGIVACNVSNFASKVASGLKPYMPNSANNQEIQAIEHPLAQLYNATDEETYELARQRFAMVCPTLNPSWAYTFRFAQGADKFEQSRNAIQTITTNFMSILEPNVKDKIYGKIYELEKPVTDDLKWGENHAFDNIPRLIKAIDSTIALENITEGCEPLLRVEMNQEEKACFYQLDAKAEIPQKEIAYINGVGTSFNVAKSDADRISNNVCFGHNIHGIWNPPRGFFKDLINSMKLMGGSLLEPTNMLVDQWKGFFANNPPDATYLQICFSQGALMVRNAMQELDPSLRKRIRIIAIAPACFFPPVEGIQVRHFVKRSDHVPTVFAVGNDRLNNEDPEIIIVPDNDYAHPHDPHGWNYREKIRPYIEKYIQTGSLL